MQQRNPIIYYQQQQIQPRSFHTSSDNASPLLTIAVLCIIGAAAALLLAYYVLVNKCRCSSLPFNLPTSTWCLPSSSATAATGQPAVDDSFIALSPGNWPRGGGGGGLDELTIQALPTREYRTGGVLECGGGIYGCVVCLNEFKEEDILRVLPNCAHAFHLPCIDLWMQSNAICPLCRTSISSAQLASGHNPRRLQVVAPSSSPRGSQQQAESVLGSDEDFVVIELGGDVEGRSVVSEAHSPAAPRRRFGSQSPEVIGKRKQSKRGGRHLSVMGDEGIDYVRMGKEGEGDQFAVQPIRRSFSWDSAADRQLLSSVRALLIRRSSSGGGSHSRARNEGRCFFPFG
ncbi:unnamed protein product [Linum tenue]|uniref:RING-type E3 ubiquitin transferase n=1 Tax=Linum tenue TaxID=586396 RepID=A0AAV0HNH3_9ROSI|nr:unnamed protein product [Linum tenue]